MLGVTGEISDTEQIASPRSEISGHHGSVIGAAAGKERGDEKMPERMNLRNLQKFENSSNFLGWSDPANLQSKFMSMSWV